jgi:hypothetical protein
MNTTDWFVFIQQEFIKCDIITELNISNIATASETFVRKCDE